MMKNEAVLSGLINGELTNMKNDGVIFTLSDVDKDGKTKDFLVTAYSENAKLLKAKAKTGERVVLVGRLSREELDEGSKIYHDTVQITKLLSLGGTEGTGYARAIIEGAGSLKEVRRTRDGAGPAVASINIKHERSFKNRDGEENTFTSYHTGVLWKDKAEALESQAPFEEKLLSVSGSLIPSTYPSTKHEGVTMHKLEVWGDDFFMSDDLAQSTSSATATPKPSTPRQSSTRSSSARTKNSSDGEIPF